MAQTQVPGLILPAPNDPTRISDNLAALLRWGKTVSPRMLFAGTPLFTAGAAPPSPPSDVYLEGFDTPTVTFSAGHGTVTFPVPFRNGVAAINLQSLHATSTAVETLRIVDGSVSLSGFGLWSSIGGTGNSAISYRVLGW